MSPRNAAGVRQFSAALAGRAIPAAAHGVQDLRHGHLTAVKVVTSDDREPLDADTVLRLLHSARESPEMLAQSIIFDLGYRQLPHLPQARQFTERPLIAAIEADGLFDDPADFIAAVREARARGWEIGLRRVGGSYRSLAALAIIEPALIVLDPRHVADSTSPLGLEAIQAVAAYSQATGASVIAGHLDAAADLRRATRLAATLGWGAVLRPATESLHENYELDLFTAPLLGSSGESCYDIAASRHRPQHTTASVLEALSETVEQQAMAQGPSTVVCAALLDTAQVTPAIWRRYAALSRTAHSVTVLAAGADQAPATGVATFDLERGDPLRQEWVVLVLAPTSAVLLTARALPTSTRGKGRDFTFVLSYERELVTHAARSIFSRLRGPRDAVATPVDATKTPRTVLDAAIS